ncbi:MAG: hypothetical protein AAGE94_19280, partial [Acidobacteriota bacterium]
LCPAGQDVCLGGLAADLLSDKARYRAMRAAARERAETFSVERVLASYERDLSCLIANGEVCDLETEGSCAIGGG